MSPERCFKYVKDRGEGARHRAWTSYPQNKDLGEQLKRSDRRDDSEEEDLWRKQRHRDTTKLLPDIGAIDLRRIIVLGIDTLQPGKENQSLETDGPPRIEDDEHRYS